MTKENIEKLQVLLDKKSQLEGFIDYAPLGAVGMASWEGLVDGYKIQQGSVVGIRCQGFVDDVQELARKWLDRINKEIEEL